MAYKLKLLEILKLHSTFHVNFLNLDCSDPDLNRMQAKRNPQMIRVEFSKEITNILKDRKMENWKNKWTKYLIHWKEAPASEASWEKGATLWQLEDQIHKYMKFKSRRTSTGSSGEEFVSPSTR